jgi:hypothetical protein
VRKHDEFAERAAARFVPLRRLSSVAVLMGGALKRDYDTLLRATGKSSFSSVRGRSSSDGKQWRAADRAQTCSIVSAP